MSRPGRGRGRGHKPNGAAQEDFPALGLPDAKAGRGRSKSGVTRSPGEISPGNERTPLANETNCSPNMTVAVPQASKEKSAVSDAKFPRRPGYGTVGRKMEVITNYYTLKSNLENIYHYDIEITSLDQIKKYGKPARKRTAAEAAASANISNIEHQMDRNVGKARCLQIFQQLIASKKLQSFQPVYDGNKTIFTFRPLPAEFDTPQNFTVALEDSGRARKYSVAVQPALKKNGTNEISLKDFMRGKHDKRSEVLMALNAVLNHRDEPSSQVKIGCSFFFLNQQEKVSLGEGLEIWFGYNQSVHLTEKGPALVINLSAKAFHKAGPVIEYANEVLGRDITRGQLKDWEIRKIEEALKRVRVQVTHLRYPRKYYVDGISKRSAQEVKTNIDGKEISIADYFRTKYGALRFPHLPCLFMRSPKNQTYIPLENCVVMEGQPKLGKLSPAMGAKMIRQTAIVPAERFKSIQNSAHDVQQQSGEKMRSYNLLMDLRPLLAPGRVLDSPSLAYLNEAICSPDNRGVWRMEGKNFFRAPQKINQWVIISFARCSERDLKNLGDTLKKAGRDLGLNLDRFAGYNTYGPNQPAEKVLNDVASNPNMTFAVIVLNRQDRYHNYDEIKFVADYKLGFVTQCMEDKVMMRMNNQIANNVCLKINTKLGGVNHTLMRRPVVFKRPVIVLGADAVHSPRGMGCPSIAAVVGSMDAYPSKYKVECRVQENEKVGKISQELILETQSMVAAIFRAFQESTKGKHPEKILFFRDGVSEGQFKKVRDYEVDAVQKASTDVFGFIIPITFVVVQKRHQTRLRPKNPAHGVGKGGNVPPGLTVDREITDPEYFDYFLNSHEGIQGTSKPAHYTVLHDDNQFGADELQELSYHLCYMYSKCNRSISIPAPVMYADLACFRAKKYADFHIQKEGMSVSSDSSGCRLPDHVKDAINAMGQFKTSMFFL